MVMYLSKMFILLMYFLMNVWRVCKLMHVMINDFLEQLNQTVHNALTAEFLFTLLPLSILRANIFSPWRMIMH